MVFFKVRNVLRSCPLLFSGQGNQLIMCCMVIVTRELYIQHLQSSTLNSYITE